MRGVLAAAALVVALRPSWSGAVDVVGASALQPGAPKRPEPSTCQSGDVIWPRLPNAVVPYDSAPGPGGPDESMRWTAQKQAYLSRSVGVSSPLDAQRRLTTRAVEAVPPRVTAVTYDAWLSKRSGEMVWRGRLRDQDSLKRARIAAEAATQKDKPYSFWNFDLRDESGFYCSKLAWLSIVKATGVPPDDNPEGTRWTWYSPKQLMMSRQIGMLFSPEPYGSQR